MSFPGRLLLLLLVLLVFAPPSFGSGDRIAALSLYNNGVIAQKAGNMAKAAELFAKSTKADPEYPWPLFALGRLHQQKFEKEMHEYSEAISCYEKLLNILLLNPPEQADRELNQGFLYMGLLHLKGGEYSEAIVDLDQFLEVEPKYEKIHEVQNARGIAYYYMDQYEKAVACFKRAMDQNPEYSEARFNLRSVFTRVSAYNEAMVLYRSGELGKALRRLEHLTAIAPRYTSGRRLEAKILSQLEKFEESVAVYEEILGFAPNDPETYWMRIELARDFMALGRNSDARLILFDNLGRFPNIEDQRARMEVVLLLTKLGGTQ